MKQRRYISEPVTTPTPRDQTVTTDIPLKPVRNLTTCFITKYHHSETCLEQKLVSGETSLFRQRRGKTYLKTGSKEPAEIGLCGKENSCRNQKINIGRLMFLMRSTTRYLARRRPPRKWKFRFRNANLGPGPVRNFMVTLKVHPCTGRTAHTARRGIALPFHDHGTRRG
jgi:hypothetical protein